MALPAAERQRRWRSAQRKSGIVTVTVDIPTGTAAELRLLAEALRENRDLMPGPLRNVSSGRLVSAKTVLKSGGRN
jgi:hypothetical protein